MALLIGVTLTPSLASADPAPPVGTAVPTPSPAAQTPTSPSDKAKTDVVDENSASYVDGYSDGCASANLRYARQAHVKPNRDLKLYDVDINYHKGWDHGYRKCEDHASTGALPVMGNSVIQ